MYKFTFAPNIITITINITQTDEEHFSFEALYQSTNPRLNHIKIAGTTLIHDPIIKNINEWLIEIDKLNNEDEPLPISVDLNSFSNKSSSMTRCLSKDCANFFTILAQDFVKKVINNAPRRAIQNSINQFNKEIQNQFFTSGSTEFLKNILDSTFFIKACQNWQSVGIKYINSKEETDSEKVCILIKRDSNNQLLEFSINYNEQKCSYLIYELEQTIQIMKKLNLTFFDVSALNEKFKLEFKIILPQLEYANNEKMISIINQFNEKHKDIAKITCEFNRETGYLNVNMQAYDGLIFRNHKVRRLFNAGGVYTSSNLNPTLFSTSRSEYLIKDSLDIDDRKINDQNRSLI